MGDTQKILELLLTSDSDRWQVMPMADWFAAFRQAAHGFENSIDRALLGGRQSDSVGFAFAGAYQSAIEALFGLDEPLLASVCVTETGGNHSRAINARLYQQDGGIYLSGEKSFVSGAKDSGMIYVACKDEREGDGLDSEGRPVIKMLALRTDTEGVEIQEMPSLGFVPEISHGKVKLDKVALEASAILPGDGYLNYVKAFRTYEDLHVCAAIAAYRLGECLSSSWGYEVIERHIALILSLREVNALPLNSPVAHLALSACRAQLDELIAQTNTLFEKNNIPGYENWQRDSRLLKVASKAHETRTQRARAKVF